MTRTEEWNERPAKGMQRCEGTLMTAAIHHSKMDHSLYDGLEVTCVPTTLFRREPMVERQFVGNPGPGQFLNRDLYQSL
jgi:hypothetical protein